MLSLIFAAALLAPGDQFDLACSGTLYSSGTQGDVTTEPFTERFRIDLDRKVWCIGTCADPRPILSITPSELVLSDQSIDQVTDRRRINRNSGSFQIYIQATIGSATATRRAVGSCAKAEFTSIPSRLF